ncbi:hypothetical protein TSUD_308930 [Trifolium subterraneum]|nr:hypothetical protein TSUD_308930 [Trifolium subterraneum]
MYFVSSVINVFSKHGAIKFARNVFDESSNRNVVCWTSLVSGYCSCSLVSEARELFDEMPERNDASYSAMVYGYVKNGFYSEGIQLFCEFKKNNKGCAGVKPSGSLLVNVLNACTMVGAFEEGKWIHSYIEENGLEYELELGTALIDFYAKCGWVKSAEQVFDKMFVKDVATWSAMISGLAFNGNNLMALELFEKMEKVGPKPNEKVGKYLIEFEPQHSGRYILLANMYANLGKWEGVSEVRKLMKDRRVLFVSA